MTDDEGWTALHYSAKEGSYQSVKLLLAMGTNIDLKINNGNNCLHIAAGYGHLNLSRILINKHNVDVQLPNNHGWTPVHYFAQKGSYGLVKTVADMGLDINIKTNNGKNCLHIATEKGHLSLCRMLISKHNFDVQLPDNDGWTAVHFFAQKGSYELVKAVADMGIDLNVKTNDGQNCLHISAENSHFNLCWALIRKHNFDVQLPDRNGCTALHYFAQNGRYELVKTIVDMGIDINLKTNDGKNCVHIAAEYGHFNLCWILISKHNVDAQFPDHDGWTAFHYFAKKGDYELVKAVADMGIDTNLKANDGKNCLRRVRSFQYVQVAYK